MANRELHRFIAWLPLAMAAIFAFVCSNWDTPKSWAANVGIWLLSKMTEPWNIALLLLLLALLVAGYLWLFLKSRPETPPSPNYADLAELLAQRLMPLPPISATVPQRAFVQPDNATHGHTVTSPAVTGQMLAVEEGDSASITGVLGLSGLYVGYIIAAAGHLEAKHYLEFAIVGFNGAADTIQICEIEGRIRVGTGNLRDHVKLPAPLFQGALNAEPGKEFVLQMRQDVSAEQAGEYLVALGEAKSVSLDLRELNIIVSSVSNHEKRARLPLWDGVNLRRRDDVVSVRNTIMSVGAAVETNVSLGMVVARVDGTTETRDA